MNYLLLGVTLLIRAFTVLIVLDTVSVTVFLTLFNADFIVMVLFLFLFFKSVVLLTDVLLLIDVILLGAVLLLTELTDKLLFKELLEVNELLLDNKVLLPDTEVLLPDTEVLLLKVVELLTVDAALTEFVFCFLLFIIKVDTLFYINISLFFE